MKRGISFDSVWEIKSMHKPYAPTSHPITLPQNGVLEIGLLEYGARRLRSKIPETPEFTDRRLRPKTPAETPANIPERSGGWTGVWSGVWPGDSDQPETPGLIHRRLRVARRLRPSWTGDSGLSELQRLYFEWSYKYLSPTSSYHCDFHSLSSITAAHQSFKISLPSH